MAEEQLLLDAIRADPEPENYLVYGDWLSERGDPRGELIGFQHALAQNPGDAALAARVQKLQAAQLATLPKRVEVTWKLGFISGIRIDANPAGLRELFAHPLLQMLESISTIDDHALFSNKQSKTHERRLELVLAAAPSACLRRLAIGSESAPLIPTVAVLQRILERFPRLDELALHTSTLPPGCIEVLAPIVRSLELACRLGAKQLREIASTSWPKLERLALHVPTRERDRTKRSPLLALMSGRNVPHLVDLRVREYPRAGVLTEQFCLEVVKSPLLARLEILDFSTNGLDVDIVRPSYPQLRHLKTLLPSAEEELDVTTLQRLTYFLEEPDTERAIAISRRVLSMSNNPHDRHNIHRRIGTCLNLLSRLDEALAAVDASLADVSSCGATLFQKAYVLKRLGRLDDAVECLERATAEPHHPPSALRTEYLRASLAIGRGEPLPPTEMLERMATSYAEELRTMAVDADMHYELACIYALLGRPESVVAMLAECFALCPPYRAWAVTEIDFAALRDTQAFRQVLVVPT